MPAYVEPPADAATTILTGVSVVDPASGTVTSDRDVETSGACITAVRPSVHDQHGAGDS